MRVFLQLDGNGKVTGELFSDTLPGDKETLPVDMIEVTGRGGHFLGMIYTKGTDTFAPAPLDPAEEARKNVLAALNAKPAVSWTTADIAAFLKAKI